MSVSLAMSRARVEISFSAFARTRMRNVSSGPVVSAASPDAPDNSSSTISPCPAPDIIFFITVLLTSSIGFRRCPSVHCSLLVSKQVHDREVGDGTEEKIRCGDQEADHVTGLDPLRRPQKKRDQHSGKDAERKDAYNLASAQGRRG